MNEPLFNQLEKGKTYDICMFDGLGSKIGTVLQKEKNTKDKVGSLEIQFQRSPVYFDKNGIKHKQTTRFTVWIMGDYPVYSYRELDGYTISGDLKDNKEIEVTA